MPGRTGLCYIKNVPRQLPKGGRVLVPHANSRIKSRELTTSVVGRREPVAIRTWNRANADGQVCRIIVPREGYENPPDVTGQITPADMRMTV